MCIRDSYDIDTRKVGTDVNKAIFVEPNCTTVFYADLPETAVQVRMGKILDGFSHHMSEYPDRYTFVVGKEPEPTKDGIVGILLIKATPASKAHSA